MADLYPRNSDPNYGGGADYGFGTDRPVQADIPAQGPPVRRGQGGLATGALALLGLSIAAIMFRSVVLPDPEGPISARNSPLAMSIDTSSSAVT